MDAVNQARFSRAFTLVEVLVVVAVIALLLAILSPSLRLARQQTKRVTCGANLAQFGRALHLYATEYRGRTLPLAYVNTSTIISEPPIYWWGASDATSVDHTRGILWPFLGSDLKAGGVYECPEQAWGTYVPQGAAKAVTSTYGYNGYYLSPAHTPGWSASIGHRPWPTIETVRHPQFTFAFADTMLHLGSRLVNSALLDPPMLYQGGSWSPNFSPTTAFRHGLRTNVAHVDGHVSPYAPAAGMSRTLDVTVGSVDEGNDPHYVPDWRDW